MTAPLLTEKELSQIRNAVNDAREHNSVVGLMELGQCVPRLLSDVHALLAANAELEARLAGSVSKRAARFAVEKAIRECVKVGGVTEDMAGCYVTFGVEVDAVTTMLDARAEAEAAKPQTDKEPDNG